jgi:hypothetical protein
MIYVWFSLQAGDIELHTLNTKTGKGFMKKCRVSPDGYIQMALQLAFHKLHKETPKTYEPSTTRYVQWAILKLRYIIICKEHASDYEGLWNKYRSTCLWPLNGVVKCHYDQTIIKDISIYIMCITYITFYIVYHPQLDWLIDVNTYYWS